MPCSVRTVTGAERGPSPAGLKATIWMRYSVNMSMNGSEWLVCDAGTT